MRRRQKVVVGLLLHAQSTPTRTQLMKWLFLLRHESVLARESTFYDFVPYRYGPFSFDVYREVDDLTRSGLVAPDKLAVPSAQLSQATQIESTLPGATRLAIAEILHRYGALSTSRLRALVYDRYPWYASRSELRSQAPRRAIEAPLAVYTIGYEGRSIDGFLDALLQAGIKMLIDVRSNPMSRKYGFSGGSLRKLAGRVRIAYSHFPDLGIDSCLRRGLGTELRIEELLDRYELKMMPLHVETVMRVGELLKEQASALLCFESDARCCHRGRLGGRLAELTGLPLVHL